MPTLTIYHHTEFPAIFKWQAIAFMRMEWPSIFQGDNLYMPETYPPDFNPVHFVIAEGETLLSYGEILRLNIDHNDSRYQVYGFGNMLTFPPFRRQAWGGQVLKAGTNLSSSAVWTWLHYFVILIWSHFMPGKDGGSRAAQRAWGDLINSKTTRRYG